MREISFKTADGIKEAAGKTYHERMTSCVCRALDPDEDVASFYLSRAYISDHVLVYTKRNSDGKIYLENLSTNVNIVDEINSFDFVEY